METEEEDCTSAGGREKTRGKSHGLCETREIKGCQLSIRCPYSIPYGHAQKSSVNMMAVEWGLEVSPEDTYGLGVMINVLHLGDRQF